jgi:hypothetical protein
VEPCQLLHSTGCWLWRRGPQLGEPPRQRLGTCSLALITTACQVSFLRWFLRHFSSGRSFPGEHSLLHLRDGDDLVVHKVIGRHSHTVCTRGRNHVQMVLPVGRIGIQFHLEGAIAMTLLSKLEQEPLYSTVRFLQSDLAVGSVDKLRLHLKKNSQ